MKPSLETNDKIKRVIALLKGAQNILFITGAGISADSGLPTYRGIGGLYNDTVTDEGIPIEMALAGETLERNPEITWKYLSQIEKRCRGAKFNRAHQVIAEMEKHFPRVWVFTQNIDSFHQQAGSQKVIDIHGDMHKIYCPKCGFKITVKDYSEIEIPPKCSRCFGIMRPDVVFFGEMLPADKCACLTRELQKGFDLYFSVGTTSVFPYIAHPIINAKYLARPTVEINPAETEVSELVDIKINSGAAQMLDEIYREFLKEG